MVFGFLVFSSPLLLSLPQNTIHRFVSQVLLKHSLSFVHIRLQSIITYSSLVLFSAVVCTSALLLTRTPPSPISCVYMRHLSLLSERSCIFLQPKRTLFSPPPSFQLSYLPMLAISTSSLPRLFFSGTFVSCPSPHHPPYPIGSLVAINLFVLFYSPAYGGHCKSFADRQR